MQTSPQEYRALILSEAVGRLKALGVTFDVAVTAGVVMVSSGCKYSAKTLRKAIKTACARLDAVSVETRPAKGFYVFTIAA
jgi:ferric-dicitrate binding protein FerR (iron transport regulator)